MLHLVVVLFLVCVANLSFTQIIDVNHISCGFDHTLIEISQQKEDRVIIPIDFGMESVDKTPVVPLPNSMKKLGLKFEEVNYGIIPNEQLRILAETNQMNTITKDMFIEPKIFESIFTPPNSMRKSSVSLKADEIDPAEDLRLYDPNNYVTVIVTVDPPVSSVPISWSWTDPDDPASSSVIDTNGSSGDDNRGSGESFTYTETVTDSNGKATAIFYLPSQLSQY